MLASLGEQCDRLTNLLNGLLLLARADAGEVLIATEAIDLAALACEVGETFDPLAEERGIQLITETSAPLIVAGDPARWPNCSPICWTMPSASLSRPAR